MCQNAALAFAVYTIAALPLLAFPAQGMSLAGALASVALGLTLVALTVVDIQWYRLPDVLTVPLAVTGIALGLADGWAVAGAKVMAAGIGFGVLYAVAKSYERIRGQAGLGLGDAKLLAASGAWLGAAALPTVVLIAAVSALLAAAGMQLRGHEISRTTKLPFGPFLALGTWLVWLYGAFN